MTIEISIGARLTPQVALADFIRNDKRGAVIAGRRCGRSGYSLALLEAFIAALKEPGGRRTRKVLPKHAMSSIATLGQIFEARRDQ